MAYLTVHSSVIKSLRFPVVENWVSNHPTTAKVLKVATLALGVLLLASVPFAISWGGKTLVSLSVGGTVALIAFLILFASDPSYSKAPTARLAKPSPLSEKELSECWQQLQSATQAIKIPTLTMKQANHHFRYILCPLETAVLVETENRYLHANRVQAGDRSFVASQSPVMDDYALFWRAILRDPRVRIIVDLTTPEDQIRHPTYNYKGFREDGLSVERTGEEGRLSTYRVKDNKTGENREIQRFHDQDWKDTFDLNSLVALINEIERLSPNPQDPVWVYCLTGMWLTGTLMSAFALKYKITSGQMGSDFNKGLIETVVEIRKQRGPECVQSRGLALLHQYGASLIPS